MAIRAPDGANKTKTTWKLRVIAKMFSAIAGTSCADETGKQN